MQYIDRETVKLHVAILKILYREKGGYLRASEIKKRLPKIHLPKLLKPIRHFPQFTQNINYHMTKLEMMGFVGGFDKGGFEREDIPSSEKYYDLTKKGEDLTRPINPKNKEEAVNLLFNLMGGFLAQRTGKRPEEIYKDISELLKELED